MEHQSRTKQGRPLAYRFVGQSSRKVDQSSHSAIRSHAMKEFRNRQRQQKKQEILRTGQQSVMEDDLSLCRCLPLAQLSLASSEQYSKSQRLDTSSPPFTSAPECCDRCGGVRLLRSSPSQQVDVLQQHSSLTTFATADFDPFDSITELPLSLTSKFTNEINAIKTHGSYITHHQYSIF